VRSGAVVVSLGSGSGRLCGCTLQLQFSFVLTVPCFLVFCLCSEADLRKLDKWNDGRNSFGNHLWTHRCTDGDKIQFFR
jgi:hypothetical protein